MPGAGARRLTGRLATVLLFACLIFTWGGNYTWMKLALVDMGPHTFNALRVMGSVVLIGALIAAADGPAALVPGPGERVALAVVGLLQIGAMTVLILLALGRIEAGRTVLVIYTLPVWVLLMSLVLLGERMTWLRAAGIALGIGGIAVLTNPLAMRWDGAVLPGISLALASTVCWALGSVLYQRRAWRTGYPAQVFWQLLATALGATAFALALEWGRPFEATPRLAAILAWNAIGPTALAYWCWSVLITRMPATTASQILLLTPVYGVLQAHVVLAEPLGPTIALAALCILAGALLTLWRPAMRP
jgi:drug/metabolite transporter (DMT)-like permease